MQGPSEGDTSRDFLGTNQDSDRMLHSKHGVCCCTSFVLTNLSTTAGEGVRKGPSRHVLLLPPKRLNAVMQTRDRQPTD